MHGLAMLSSHFSQSWQIRQHHNLHAAQQSVAKAKKKIEALLKNEMIQNAAIIPPFLAPEKPQSPHIKDPMWEHQLNL